jgi:hypothetical protein
VHSQIARQLTSSVSTYRDTCHRYHACLYSRCLPARLPACLLLLLLLLLLMLVLVLVVVLPVP